MTHEERQPFRLTSFLSEILRHRRVFTEVYILTLVISLIGLITPLFFQVVIDKVTVHQSYSTLLVLGVGVIAAIGFESLFLLIHDYLLLDANQKIDLRISSKVFRQLLSLPVTFFENREAGALTRDVQQDGSARDFLTGRLFFSLTQLTALAVFLPLLFAYNAILAWSVLGFSGAVMVISLALAPAFRQRMTSLYHSDGDRQALLVETLHGMGTVKALGLEDTRRQEWEQKSAQALQRSREFHWLAIKARVSTSLIEKLMPVAIIWIGALMVFDGRITIGQLVAFQMLAGRVTGPLLQLVSLIHGYQGAALAAKRLGEIMDAEPEARSSGVTPPLKGAIAFENVCFQYSGSSGLALDRVSFSIQPGCTLGVVGRSGSGKSTLTRLVHGMLAPHSGTVWIDDFAVEELDRAHLRRNIGVVPQEAFLFRGTVRDNIAAGRPSASFEDIAYAARQAGADKFIRQLPQGYETVLREGAVNLSGGQRQRLAIARALVRQPRILILDEATSALDLESEAAIQANMAEITRERTTIIVTHRLSSLSIADVILVIDNGSVVGFGSHDELLSSCLAYRQLWTSQTGGFLRVAAE
jgi:ATP-binding cassette, subfamily B, bacterial HlyB/CyaB